MTAPKLEQLETFEEIFKNYEMSPKAIELLHKTNLVALVSPTSAGRNTIINKLVETERYVSLVSDTTRPKRINNGVLETDGVEYNFKTEQEFIDGLRAGDYLEFAIIHKQQVSGMSMEQLRLASEHGKIAVNEIEIIGAAGIAKVKPDAHIIFVLPPSYEEWMKRLKDRGEMSQDEFRNRIESAELELEDAIKQDYYKFVINDDLDEAVAMIEKIVENDYFDPEYQQKGKDLAWKLVNRIKETLSS